MEKDTAASIETKEIRGINIKIMLTIIGAVISSTVAIIMTINSLRTDILKINSMQDMMDLKLRTLDIRVTTLEQEQKEQNRLIQQNEDRLNDAKWHGR